MGSSPRMRGAHRPLRPHVHRRGIIPAYAGSTPPATTRTASARDHPRVCGEHTCSDPMNARISGSSPRMRGAPGRWCYQRPFLGIIPAYAGSTNAIGSARTVSRDHPRVCGEHAGSGFLSAIGSGSSPRMRGALLTSYNEYLGKGIIPAYAGSTPARRGTARRSRDHPRVCGEHPAVTGCAVID